MKQSIFITIAAILTVVSIDAAGDTEQEKTKPPDPIVVENPYVTPQKPLIGAVRPDFELRDVNGVLREVREWDGKILFLNFWATWCGPCLMEIPVFIELQEQYKDDGVQFVGIALHEADEIQDYLSFVDMNYPALVGIEAVTTVAKSFGNRFIALPYTVVIGRDRQIYFIRSGPLRHDEADALIQSLL